MHNEKILNSITNDCEERRAFHTGQNGSIGSRGHCVSGKTPDYVANIKKTSKLKSVQYQYVLQKVRALEQWVQKCIAELRIEKCKAQEYLDIAHVIILVLDMKGHVSFINKKGAAGLGYTVKEVIGKNWLEDVLRECDRANFKAIFLQSITGEDKLLDSFETIIVTGDGEEKLIEWKSTVIRDRKGTIINILISGNDITHRKNAERVLQENSRRIKEFTYFVSHDLKNPAISLIGLARCLKRKYENIFDEKGKMYCDQIMTTSGHINILVENINCFAATMEIPFCFENVDLKKICATIKEEFYEQLLSRGICVIECNTLPLCKVDKISTLRIFRNLIDNSLKYGGDTLNTITISYEESEDFHVISVKDDGKGFDKKERENIFTAFTRSTTSGNVYGTGLGLAIVKEIAEKHGGSAWAESALGEGATFYISIAKNLH